MKIRELHKYFLTSEGITTDSRENLKGKLFFALRGENFNGNQFALSAIEAGAAFAIVDDERLRGEARCLCVEDVLKTLQELSAYHRKYIGIPIIAITGSNGKTTTKELISAVLSERFKVIHTHGNLNNHIGVPLTLLRLTRDTEFAVVEMGANHQKEIEKLCQIAQPDFGYITNFGKAHLEGFGGFEGVIKGKSELYGFLKAQHKKVFINIDDKLQVKQSKGGEQIEFSIELVSKTHIKFKSANPFVNVDYKGAEINSRLIGAYNVKNIAAAICIGDYFGLNIQQIKDGVEKYNPDNNRSQIIEKDSNKILMDAYNANPTSMALALKNLKEFPGNRKVAILGDMFEIGETSLKEHQRVVDLLESLEIDHAYVCGEAFNQTTSNSEKIAVFEDFEVLKKTIAETDLKASVILIKGSRGMALERILEVL